MSETLRSLAPRLAALGMLIGALAIALVAWSWWSAPPEDVLLPRATCDLNTGPCTHTLPNGEQVRFAISPQPIPVMEDLQLRAVFTGPRPDRVDADLNGTVMKMVANQPELIHVGDNRFEAQTALSVCITGGMQWQALLGVTYGRTRYRIPFVFDTPDAAHTATASLE